MIPVTWPVAILDFEASGLSRLSYPIEVGVARWRGLDAPIEIWSTLIRPDREWIDDGYWSEAAETIHGIGAEKLAAGLPSATVCARLNDELTGCLVGCDGYAYDSGWLSQLYEAAGVKASFELESMMKLAYWGNPRMARWLNANRGTPHRAGPDALRLMRAFAFGMGRRPKCISLP